MNGNKEDRQKTDKYNFDKKIFKVKREEWEDYVKTDKRPYRMATILWGNDTTAVQFEEVI